MNLEYRNFSSDVRIRNMKSKGKYGEHIKARCNLDLNAKKRY